MVEEPWRHWPPAERLRQLLNVASRIAAEPSPRARLRFLLESVALGVGADVVGLLRLEREEMVITQVYDAQGELDRLAGVRFRPLPGQGLDEAVAEQRPVGTSRPAPSPVPELGEISEQMQHCLMYPLLVGGETVGVLVLGRRSGEPFSDWVRSGLDDFAGLTSLMAHNVMLASERLQMSEERRRLLTDMALALRPHVALLHGYATVLAEQGREKLPASWREGVVLIRQHSDHLHSLVTDLLLDSQLEAGLLDLKLERLDLSELIQERTQRLRAMGEIAGCRLEIEPSPLEAVCDPELAVRAVSILVANAILHSGSERVLIQFRPGGEVTVSDFGRGIPAARQPTLFQPFFGGTRREAGIRGGGLGLYMARQMMRAMGGDLRLEWSEEGKGSRFVALFAQV